MYNSDAIVYRYYMISRLISSGKAKRKTLNFVSRCTASRDSAWHSADWPIDRYNNVCTP